MKIIITVPGEDSMDRKVIDYVRLVANQLDAGYLSGHVKPEQHWTIEK